MQDDTRFDPATPGSSIDPAPRAAADRAAADRTAQPARTDGPRPEDVLQAGRAGRVDPDVGRTLGGSASHERASFSDPITTASGPDGIPGERVAGAWPTVEPHSDAGPHDEGRAAPVRGAGEPVRRVQDGLPEGRPRDR